MPKQQLSVVVTRRLPEVVETRMAELFDVRLRESDEPMSREELAEAIKTCDVLVPTITDQIDNAMISQAGTRLKLIANYGAGVDHIDVATARQQGVLVSNTPGVLTDDTADMTMALLLAVTRRMPEGMAKMQRGAWDGWAPNALLGGVLQVADWEFWVWGKSGKPLRDGPLLLVCRSTITTVAACAARPKMHCRQPTGKAWTRWWPAWM